MMKKWICAMLCALLLLTLGLPPVAASQEPLITFQPQNYTYPQYSTAMYTVKATGSNLSATWYIEFEGKTYNMSDYTNAMEPWEAYSGETYGPVQLDGGTFTCHFGGIEEGLNGAQIWCVISDGKNSVTSDRAIVSVQGNAMPPEILAIPTYISVYRGNSLDFRCLAKAPQNTQLSYIWYETATGKLQDIRAIEPEESSDSLFVNTGTAGTRHYVCGVFTSEGGMAYSSVVTVQVLDVAQEMEILTKALPDATVGKAYKTELKCNDPYGLFTLYYNPGGANELENSGLRLTKENFIEGTPTKAGTFTFSVCASGDAGEDYMQYTLTVKEADVPVQVTEPETTVPETTQPETTLAPVTEAPTEETPTTTENEQKDPPVIQEDPVDQGFPWWGFVLIGVVCAAAGVGTAVLLLKKKQ